MIFAMKHRRRCLNCIRLARVFDDYCGDACAREHAKRFTVVRDRDSVELQRDHRGAAWIDGRRLGLQNSA